MDYNIKQQIKKQSDFSLIQIATNYAGQYKTEAIEQAKNAIIERNITIPELQFIEKESEVIMVVTKIKIGILMFIPFLLFLLFISVESIFSFFLLPIFILSIVLCGFIGLRISNKKVLNNQLKNSIYINITWKMLWICFFFMLTFGLLGLAFMVAMVG